MPPRTVVKGASNKRRPGNAGATGTYMKSVVPTREAQIRVGQRVRRKSSGSTVRVTKKRSPR